MPSKAPRCKKDNRLVRIRPTIFSLIFRNSLVFSMVLAIIGFTLSLTTQASLSHQEGEDVPSSKLHNGIEIPLIGLGCASGVRKIHVKSALDTGYRFLDTAQSYSWGYHEDEVGDALVDYLASSSSSSSSSNDQTIFVQTKIHPQDLGYQATTRAVEKSLERLHGHLDSVLIHKPRCWEGICKKKPEGTWQDSWRALEDLYDKGVIKAIGICDVDHQILDELLSQRIKPHIIQNWMDPIHQNVEIRDRCLENGIQYQAYSTLGTQWVHHRGYSKNPVLENPTLLELAEKYKASVVQIVLHWATRRGVSVLPASTNPGRQESNLKSGHSVHLTEEDMHKIDGLNGQAPPREQAQKDSSVKIHFENPRQDGGAIDAYWVGHSQEEVPIGSIAAGSKLSLTSYHGHKFVFKDPTNGNAVLGHYIVNPKTLRSNTNEEHHHHVVPYEEL